MKHSNDSYEGRIRRAKAWGAKHGYEGARGGWIYKLCPQPVGHRPVCQGWVALFLRCQRRIEAWETALLVEQGLAQKAAAARYDVRVTRDGVTRRTQLDAVTARAACHTAVAAGQVISCREMAADEPDIVGVQEVR